MPLRVFLTGATGFIGGQLYRALSADPDIIVRALVRDPARSPELGGAEIVVGDLGEPGSLRGALDGVDVLVHAGSYLGSDPVEQERTNQFGTAQLMLYATAARIPRIVSISTASVYGSGPHRGVRVNEFAPHPESALSWSRLAAESRVLDAGGTVIRPHLVYGERDRRVLPAILAFTAGLGAIIDGGSARVSVIRADHLAAQIAALIRIPDADAPDGILHAANPLPPSVLQILTEAERALGIPVPEVSISVHEALDRAASLGVSRHQASMIAVDGWFDAAELWAIGGQSPITTFVLDEPSTSWYASLLTPEARP